MVVQEATLHDEALNELGLSKQPFLEDKKLQRFADSAALHSSNTCALEIRCIFYSGKTVPAKRYYFLS